MKRYFTESNDAVLEHYGVKGMKWGVRKIDRTARVAGLTSIQSSIHKAPMIGSLSKKEQARVIKDLALHRRLQVNQAIINQDINDKVGLASTAALSGISGFKAADATREYYDNRNNNPIMTTSYGVDVAGKGRAGSGTINFWADKMSESDIKDAMIENAAIYAGVSAVSGLAIDGIFHVVGKATIKAKTKKLTEKYETAMKTVEGQDANFANNLRKAIHEEFDNKTDMELLEKRGKNYLKFGD